MPLDGCDRQMIDLWQRDFPLVARPFAEMAAKLDVTEADVIARLRRLKATGALSRVGAVVRPNTVGASTLAAISVPQDRIELAADAIVTEPGVNHAYEREHAFNLWFVVTAPDANGVAAAIARIEASTGARALVLPMLQDFHIDLGFSLFGSARRTKTTKPASLPAPIDAVDRRLLAATEDGLDLVPSPFASVSARSGMTEAEVLMRLKALVASGVVLRFGLVVRHRHFGYAANAMVVWDIPDESLKQVAGVFAAQDFVTLCYERPRRPGWRYNLFTMIHGRARDVALAQVDDLAARAPEARGHAILFSRRCFVQRGAKLSAA